ncbi:MAG: hypothetical protein HYR76_00735 [Ignavibacteria bacterium]|nr:hypothetical protein [Ignavibacteria bacterium]MBI3765546.1 hypothetical protein [Ignavibacteriales bacterium]
MEKPRAFLVHWKREELPPKVKLLRSLGFTVLSEHGDGDIALKTMKEKLPAVAVIYLTRLPSHGSRVAEVLQWTKSTRDIPIVFVDGEPGKIDTVKQRVPNAVFTTEVNLKSILQEFA